MKVEWLENGGNTATFKHFSPRLRCERVIFPMTSTARRPVDSPNRVGSLSARDLADRSSSGDEIGVARQDVGAKPQPLSAGVGDDAARG